MAPLRNKLFNRVPSYERSPAEGFFGRAMDALQNPNEGVAVPGYNSPPDISTNRLDMLRDTPRVTSSSQAGLVSPQNPMSGARMTNGYSPLPSSSEGRLYGLSLPMDRAGQSNRLANQNPMFQGMQQRFGAGSAIGQQAAQIQAGQAAVASGSAIEIPGNYGEMPSYRPVNHEAEASRMQQLLASTGANREALLNKEKRGVFAFENDKGVASGNRLGALRAAYAANPDDVEIQMALQDENLIQRNLAEQRKASLPARNEAKRARKALEKSRRADVKFKHLVSRGLNPNSAKARAMFPEQTGRLRGLSSQNPMAQPVAQPGTLESMVEGASKVEEDLTTNPHFVSLGLTPDSTMFDIHTAVSAHLNTGGELSPESLKAFQDHAKARKKTEKEGENAFDTGQFDYKVGEDLWREIAELPDNDRARLDWYEKFKKRGEEWERRRHPEGDHSDVYSGEGNLFGV